MITSYAILQHEIGEGKKVGQKKGANKGAIMDEGDEEGEEGEEEEEEDDDSSFCARGGQFIKKKTRTPRKVGGRIQNLDTHTQGGSRTRLHVSSHVEWIDFAQNCQACAWLCF